MIKEESGQWHENVDRTHLVLASGKILSFIQYRFQLSRGILDMEASESVGQHHQRRRRRRVLRRQGRRRLEVDVSVVVVGVEESCFVSTAG